MTEDHPWRPTRERLADALRAALAPVVACAVALAGLAAWAGTGNAGTPARIDVSPGRVFLPYGDSRAASAFFTVSNTGDTDTELVAVTSPEVEGDLDLSRHRMTRRGAAYRAGLGSVTVPADGRLTMSPHGVDVTLRSAKGWRVGDVVPFTLHFRDAPPVRTVAVVIRPGDLPS